MKTVALILIALELFATICAGFVLGGEEFVKSCQRSINLNESDLYGIRKGDFDEISQDGKCYFKCVYEGLRFMKDGRFAESFLNELEATYKAFQGIPDAHSIVSPLKECLHVTGEGCELAHEYAKCLSPKFSERGVFDFDSLS